MNSRKKISYTGPLIGRLQLPGDKSISHRAAMLLGISEGSAKIENYATGDDCASTIRCMEQLGVSIDKSGSTVTIAGKGKHGLRKPDAPLDCGNSGTTMRLLAGILAGQHFDSVLTGDESLSGRPMERIKTPLIDMSADVRLSEGHAPISIRGKQRLTALKYHMPVASAQVKSCVIFAGLYGDGPTVVASPPSEFRASVSRDHTERMLEYLGADIEESFLEKGDKFCHAVSLNPESKLQARNINIPGDISTAAFFLVAAAGLKGSDLTLANVGLNKTRISVVDVLKKVGVRIAVTEQTVSCNEPRGDIRVSWDGDCELIRSELRISGGETAALIDEIPILAVLGTLLPGGIEIRDASELRLKESDRIDAVVSNLVKMGAQVEEFDDGLRVSKSSLNGAVIDSRGDHRIAMAFAVAAMLAKGESDIIDSDCVSVSYPGFFDAFGGLID